jgi:hypothetical protein
MEALLRRHTLVLLEGIVPRLGGASEVVGHQPCLIRNQCALAPEELFTVIEPVEGVCRSIIRRKLQLVEVQRSMGTMERTRGEGTVHCRRRATLATAP